MLGMGGGGRDLGVTPGRIEAFLRDRGVIVQMDQIVRDAGMLRLAFCDRFQDRRALDLIGVGLVGGRSRGVERKRVMNLRFVVVRVALRQLLHGFRVGHDAGAVIDLVKVGIHDAQRIQIVTLALASRRQGSCPWRSWRHHRRDFSQAWGRGDSRAC